MNTTQRYLERGTVFPSEAAQARYPLTEFPCRRCEREGLPHLVDNSSEYYWEHQHERPGSSARSGCPRFGRAVNLSPSTPRPGTAKPTYYQGWHRTRFERESSK